MPNDMVNLPLPIFKKKLTTGYDMNLCVKLKIVCNILI